jgi:hypothetical protein
MRFSPNPIALAATGVAALLLAACAGHGVVPATGSFAPSALSPDTVRPDAKKTPKPTPCAAKQVAWTFAGACGTVAIKATGGTASMAAYEGFTITATFAKTKGPAPVGEILVVRDGTTPSKDIKGLIAGHVFPPFTKAGNPSQAVTPVIYLKAQNVGPAFTFSETPAIKVVSAKPFPGNTCILTLMASNYTWPTTKFAPGVITGKSVAFPMEPQPIEIPKDGTLYIAMACTNTH